MTGLRPTARVARGATYLFAQGFFTAVIGLVYFIVLAHTFSAPSEQWQTGAFALLSFILSLVQIFGTFALPSAATKYIAQHLAEGDPKKARAVTARVLQIGFLASSVAFLALFVPAEWLSSLMFGTVAYAFLFRLMAICSIFTILYLEVAGFLQGVQRIQEVAIINLAYYGIHSSVGVYLLLNGWRLYGVVVGWLVGSLVASVAGMILTVKYLGFLEKPYPVRTLVKFSLPLYVAGGVGFFVNWVDQLLLVSYMGLVHEAAEAQRILGIYHVAIRASAVPGLFSSSIVTALFPQLSELYAQQGSNSLRDAFRVSTRYSVLIGFPLIIGLTTLSRPIIILFAGGQYIEAVEPLIILSIAALVGAVGLSVGPILMTLERTTIVSALSIVSVVQSASLSYFALAYLGLGMIGTAWVRAIGSIISLALNLYVLKRYISVSFDKEALWKSSVASALMVLVIVAVDLMRKFVSADPYEFLVVRLHHLPVYVVIGALAYFFALVALRAVKKRDIKLVEEYLPKSLRRVAAWLERFAVAD